MRQRALYSCFQSTLSTVIVFSGLKSQFHTRAGGGWGRCRAFSCITLLSWNSPSLNLWTISSQSAQKIYSNHLKLRCTFFDLLNCRRSYEVLKGVLKIARYIPVCIQSARLHLENETTYVGSYSHSSYLELHLVGRRQCNWCTDFWQHQRIDQPNTAWQASLNWSKQYNQKPSI